MTPIQRANKIVDRAILGVDIPDLIEFIAAQIAEAEREAQDNQKFELYELHRADGTVEKWSKDFEDRIFRQGFAAAREKATEIAKDIKCGATYTSIDDCDCFEELAERIRAMEADK